MAQVAGMRSTAQIISEARNVRDVAPDIFYLEPEEQPLLTILNKLNKKKPCYSTKFTWFGSDTTARWTQVDSTTVTTTGTAIGVVDGTLFRIGDLVAIPKSVDVSTAPEIVRVTNVVTNTLTVVRNVGGSGAATIAASSSLTFAGSAFEEGAAFSAMKSTIPVEYTGYTQIFRTPIKLTKTSMATRVYGKEELRRLQWEKAKEHKIDLNRAFLFSRPSEDTTGGPTGQPIRTTDSLFNKITTNVTNANGTLTPQTIENFSRQAFRYGKSKKVLIASPIIISAFHEFAKSHLNLAPNDTQYGINVSKVVTGHGQWLLVRDWMLEDGVSGQNGFGGNAFSLDLDQITIRYLADNGINRDTKYLTDVLQDGGDYRADEYLTECGLMINQEKHHARLYNVTGYSA